MSMLPPGVSGTGLLCLSLRTAIAEAPLRSLDDLSRDVWKAHVGNLLTDGEAQELSEAIHMRRMVHRSEPARPKPVIAAEVASDAPGRPESPAKRPWSYFPAKRPQRSPERAVSLERRRKLAATGPLPPGLACKFTTGELAVLRIVSDEVAGKGVCVLSMPEIAARAGVGLTKARMALRVAASLGLIIVSERRVPYRPNLTNVVRIVSAEWNAWIARRKAKRHPTTPPATPSHHASDRKPQGQGRGHFSEGHGIKGLSGKREPDDLAILLVAGREGI